MSWFSVPKGVPSILVSAGIVLVVMSVIGIVSGGIYLFVNWLDNTWGENVATGVPVGIFFFLLFTFMVHSLRRDY